MTDIQESAVWTATIKQLDTTDPVLGGPTGASNNPLQSLANRTAYLKAQVDLKAPAAHSHAIAGVTGLQDALDAKAPYNHAHAIAGVTGLQAALDAKAPYNHAHAIAGVTGLQAALDAKAPTSHIHGMSGITGLQAAMDAKAAVIHGHAIDDVTGLRDALVVLPNRIAFGMGVIGHGQTIPLPYYSDGTRATLAEVKVYQASINHLTGRSDSITSFNWTIDCSVSNTLVVTCLYGGWAEPAATASYLIICQR